MTSATTNPGVNEPLTDDQIIESIGPYNYGWHDSDDAGASAQRGLSEDVVRDISAKKSEPEWMLQQRLKALSIFDKKPVPTWGADLSGIDFDNIKYFVRSTEKQAQSWRISQKTSRIPTTSWVFLRPRSSASLQVLQLSTSLRLSTTRSARTWRKRELSSLTPIPH